MLYVHMSNSDYFRNFNEKLLFNSLAKWKNRRH